MTDAFAPTALARRFLSCFLVLAMLALAPQVFAQTPFSPAPAPEEPPASTETPLTTLIEVLRDDAARQTLIEELEAQVAAQEPGAAEPEDNFADGAATFGGEIAEFTQRTAFSISQALAETWSQLTLLPAAFASLGNANYQAIGGLLLDLAVLVVVTYSVFLAIRYLTEAFRRRLDLRAARSGVLVLVVSVLAVLISNLVIVALAWAAGQATAVTLAGLGRSAFVYFLFLNVFVVVETTQAVVRAVLSPRRPDLRLLRMSDENARMLTGWFRWTVSVLAYGQLLLVPLFNRFVSSGTSRAVSVIIYVIALAMAVNLVLRLQEPVRDWLQSRGGEASRSPLRAFAGVWHLPVLLYLFVLFVVVLVWPADVLANLLNATFQVILAVLLGAIAAGLLHRIIVRGIKLPERVTTRIPLLEERLNAFVPRALTALRVLVFIVVAAFTLDAIGLFNLDEWLASEFGSRVATSTIVVAIILVIAFAAWLALSSWVDYRLQPANGTTVKSRERTLLTLARNAATIAIIVLAVMFILSEVGIDIAPLLASAGIIGLAIGFGAQKAVQDIITGIFIQLEGAIDVGDVVNIGGISGSVERLTIRSAALRDANGVYHIVPFSSVDVVSNFMRGFAFALCDISVAYRQNLDEVKQALLDAYEELKKNEAVAPDIVEQDLEWNGLERFLDNAMVVRVRIKTLPGRQWGVTRAYNAEVKKIFDARGIEIPHQTIYFGDDKTAGPAPMRVRAVERAPEEDQGSRESPKESPEDAPPAGPSTSEGRRAPRRPEVPDGDDFEPPDEQR